LTADDESKNFAESDSNEDISPKSVPIQFRNTLNEEEANDAPPPPDPLIGTVLGGRFEIERVLGSGGMSVVYKAKQLVVDRPVAIKTLHIQLRTRPGAVERFRREIKSLCKLTSPNIVTVYDCIFSADGQPYVVMDYLQGMSLEQLVKSSGPLSPERAQKIFLQISTALEHAHKNGVIHRDLKPSNVMIINDTDEFVKVVDFGLAKLGEDNVKLTKSGEVWGSPPYMSPEQWRSEPCDARSDIYALGTLMYEALTGRDAFKADTLYQFLQKHLNETPADFITANPNVSIPAKFERVVFKAFAKNPAQRYQSMSEVKEALSQVLSEDKFQSTKANEVSSEPHRGTMSGLAYILAGSILFLLSIVIFFVTQYVLHQVEVRMPSYVVPHSTVQSPATVVEPSLPPKPKAKPKVSRTENLPQSRNRSTGPFNAIRARRRDEPRKPAVEHKGGNLWDNLRNSRTEK